MIQPHGPVDGLVYGRPVAVTTCVHGHTSKEVVVPQFVTASVQVTYAGISVQGYTTTLNQVVQKDTQYIELKRFQSTYMSK